MKVKVVVVYFMVKVDDKYDEELAQADIVAEFMPNVNTGAPVKYDVVFDTFDIMPQLVLAERRLGLLCTWYDAKRLAEEEADKYLPKAIEVFDKMVLSDIAKGRSVLICVFNGKHRLGLGFSNKRKLERALEYLTRRFKRKRKLKILSIEDKTKHYMKLFSRPGWSPWQDSTLGVRGEGTRLIKSGISQASTLLRSL